jgi:hypothetical protein
MAFKDVLRKQRSSGSGVLSSLASATGRSVMESLDIRNYLFTKDSLLGSLFPKVKGFKADGGVSKKSPTSLMSGGSGGLSDAKLDIISQNTQISAKNSLVLPSMARDMNVMRQNIVKMVKLSGGNASTKADMFFLKASEREKSYESQMSSVKTPTKVESSEETGNKRGGILSRLSLVLMPLVGKLILVTGAVGLMYFAIKKLVDFIKGSWLGKKLGISGGSEGGDDSGIGGDNGSSLDFQNDLANVAAATGGTLAGVAAVKGASKLVGATKASGTAVLDARTMSVGYLSESKPTTKWGRFLKFVAQKSPKLWGKVGLKLAQAGALASVPLVGWVAAAVQLGLSLWAAWEIYELWREFTGTEADETTTNSGEENYAASNEFNLQNEQSTSVPTSTPVPIPQKVGMEAGRGTNRAPTPAPANQSSGLNIESIMEQVRRAEGGPMGYDAANRGKAGDTPGGMPGLSSMTVGEVRRLQKERQLFAAGAYQIIPDTMDMIMKNGIAKDSDIFNKETQDKMGRWLINRRMRIAERQGTDPQKELAKEFASIANPETGRSHYAGVGNNKASIASLDGSNNNRGSVLNTGSVSVASASAAGSSQPIVVNAPTNNVNNSSTSGGGGGGMPSVVDQDFMRYLVGKMA